MAYATVTELIDAIGEQIAADLSSEVGTYDEVVIEAALDDGQGRMDSYLGKRLELPITAPYPRDLQRLNIDLAVYFLMIRRPGLNIERFRVNYDDAIAWLRDFAAGKVELIGLTDVATAEGTLGVTVDAPDQVFTSDLLDTY